MRLAVLGAIVLTSQAAIAETRPTRVVVRSMAATSEQMRGSAAGLTEAVLIRLGTRNDLRVIGEAELSLLWDHTDNLHRLSPEACAREHECLAALTEATDADLVLNGQLGEMGKDLVVTISLSNARDLTVVGGASCLARDDRDLETCVLGEVGRLLGKGSSSASGFSIGSNRRTRIAMLDLSTYDVREGIGASLTQLTSVELKRFEDLEVIGWAEVQALLDYQIERAKLCDEDLTKCFAEIGGALGVDYLVQGAIGRLDQTYILHLKLLDVAAVDVANRVVESYRGPESQLPGLVRFGVRSLLGRTETGTGALELVNAQQVESSLVLDSRQPIPFEARLTVDALTSGKHAVTIDAGEDYFPFFAEVFVLPYRASRLDVELQEVPTPWYETWWFWTITGVVVAGTAVGTYFAVRPPNKSDVEFMIGAAP